MTGDYIYIYEHMRQLVPAAGKPTYFHMCVVYKVHVHVVVLMSQIPYALRCPQSWQHPLPWELLPPTMVMGNNCGRPKCEAPVAAAELEVLLQKKLVEHGKCWLNLDEYNRATGHV